MIAVLVTVRFPISVSSQSCIWSSLFLCKLKLSRVFLYAKKFLDCILEDMNIMLQGSGSSLNAMMNVDFYFSRHLTWLGSACKFCPAFSGW